MIVDGAQGTEPTEFAFTTVLAVDLTFRVSSSRW